MCKYIIIVSLIIFSFIYVYAGDLSAPPNLPNESFEEQSYLKSIYENINKVKIVYTNPDGNTKGKKGDMLYYDDNNSGYLEINIDSSTTWRGIKLTEVP